VTVGRGRVGSATHAALAVFLPLALRGGLCGLVRAGAGGGELDPDVLIGADGVLNDGATFAGAGGAFLLLDDDWRCGSC
jgi:hypothetical protein